jgi:hypothetical protein
MRLSQMNGLRKGACAIVLAFGLVGVSLGLAPREATSQTVSGYEFADWTGVGSNLATGTLRGSSVSLSGTHVSAPPSSRVDGSSQVFNLPVLTPPLPTSDALEIRGFQPGYSYALSFARPITSPVLHLASLGSALQFQAGTQITRVSGDSSFTVAGATVTGGGSPNPDASGTVRLDGTFSSVTFTSTTVDPPLQPDGIYFHVGVKLPPPDRTPPETAITAGPPEGGIVGDVPPRFEFASSEPGSRFECRTYDPAKSDFLERVFRPCVSPHQRVDLERQMALGERSVFEVRATDAAGNADPTPSIRSYRKHGKLGEKPKRTKCDPVIIASVHGKGVRSNCRIVQIKRGKVPCVSIKTFKARKCRFKRKSGPWVKAKNKKRYALVGTALSPTGRRRGAYVIAAPIGKKTTSPCGVRTAATKSDTASPEAGTPLSTSCYPEVPLSPYNRSGRQMDNYATRVVCTSSTPRENGDLISSVVVSNPAPGVYCYTGEGAALNDVNGTERGSNGQYMAGSIRCHVVWSNGYEVYAAKRPNVTGIPPRLDPKSPIVWRTVTHLPVAN